MTIPQIPFISVVVVTFNSGAYLERCLRALAGQKFSCFEAIIVDNASSDGAFSFRAKFDCRSAFPICRARAEPRICGGKQSRRRNGGRPLDRFPQSGCVPRNSLARSTSRCRRAPPGCGPFRFDSDLGSRQESHRRLWRCLFRDRPSLARRSWPASRRVAGGRLRDVQSLARQQHSSARICFANLTDSTKLSFATARMSISDFGRGSPAIAAFRSAMRSCTMSAAAVRAAEHSRGASGSGISCGHSSRTCRPYSCRCFCRCIS